MYIDLPLGNIDDVTVATLDEPSQLSPLIDGTVVALSIQMFGIPQSSYYINAVQRHTRSIEIAFDTVETAESLQKSLLISPIEEQQGSQSANGKNVFQGEITEIDRSALSDNCLAVLEHPRSIASHAGTLLSTSGQQSAGLIVSQSANEINVSQTHLDQLDDSNDLLGSPDPEDLMATAMQANNTILPEMTLEAMNIAHPDTRYMPHLKITDRVESQEKQPNGPLSVLPDQIVSMSAGIAIPAPTGHEEMLVRILHQPESNSESGLRSSAPWREGRKLIDRAPEFDNMLAAQDNQLIVGQESRHRIDRLVLEQNGDDTSLYNASPRAQQAKPQQATPSSERPRKDQNVEKLLGDISQADPASIYGQSSSEKSIRRLRNRGGETIVGSSSVKQPDNVRHAKDSKRPDALNKSNSMEKISGALEAKTGSQRQTKRRQGKQPYRDSKSTADGNSRNENYDAFEMPDSPPQSKRPQKAIPEDSAVEQNDSRSQEQAGGKNLRSKIPLAAASSSGSVRRTQIKKSLSSHQGRLSHSTTRKRPIKSKASGTVMVDWDEDLEVDEEQVAGGPHRGKRKTAKSKPAAVANGKASKTTKANSAKKRAVKSKASLALPVHRRTTRAAALTANKRIRGIAESDVSDKGEPLNTTPQKHDERISTARKGELSARSTSPASHGDLGGIGQKAVPTVAPETLSVNEPPDNGADCNSEELPNGIEILGARADPKRSPPDEIVLANENENFESAVEAKQNISHKDRFSTANHALKANQSADNVVLGLPMEAMDAVDLDIPIMENTHFQDAMVFSASNNLHESKSPIYEDYRHIVAVENTSEKKQASDSRYDSTRNQDFRKSQSGESWGSKFTGSLSNIPKVLEAFHPSSAMKKGKQYRTQDDPHGAPKANTLKDPNQVGQSGRRPKGTSAATLVYHRSSQRPDRESAPTGIEYKMRKGQFSKPPTNKAPATDMPCASPAVSPNSRPSANQPSEVIQIYSKGADNLDENDKHKPEVANDSAIGFVQTNDHVARMAIATSSAIDPVAEAEVAGVTDAQSSTRTRPEKRKRDAEAVSRSSERAAKRHLPSTRSADKEQYTRTPDPNRKLNLISFDVKGPRNQGITSGQKQSFLESSVHRGRHLSPSKNLQIRNHSEEDQAGDEVFPAELSAKTHVVSPTRGRHLPQIVSTDVEGRVDKPISTLQELKTTEKRDQLPVTLPLQRAVSTRQGNLGNNAHAVKKRSILTADIAAAVTVKPFIAVADMGYMSRETALRSEGKFSTVISNIVPVKSPSTAVVGRKQSPSLFPSYTADAVSGETKGQADGIAVDVLNELALRKRQRLSSEAFLKKQIAPQSIPRRSRRIENNFVQWTGSQSKKVDENGSPLPVVQSRYPSTAESQIRHTQDIIRLPAQSRNIRDQQSQCALSNDEIELDALLYQSSISPHLKKIALNTVGNSKLLPSSPNDMSSIIDEMEPHHVDPSGKYINVETENVISSHEPADPFVGRAQGRPNSFMEALRRTNQRSEKFVITCDEDESEDAQDQDPENTLVQPDSQDDQSDTASENSSTSQDSPSSKKASRKDEAEEPDEWQKALQPHHGNTLNILFDISHVSLAPSPPCASRYSF